MYHPIVWLISAFRSLFGVYKDAPGDIVTEIQGPVVPDRKTGPVTRDSFVKVGRIAMCDEGMVFHSDLDERGFILLNGDIGAVLNGDTRDIRLLDARDLAGSARLSASGRAVNISISPFYYTIPLRSVLAVLDGRNRKGAVFMGK